MRCIRLIGALALCFGLTQGAIRAEIIHTIPNSSFESRDLADGGFTAGSIPDGLSTLKMYR